MSSKRVANKLNEANLRAPGSGLSVPERNKKDKYKAVRSIVKSLHAKKLKRNEAIRNKAAIANETEVHEPEGEYGHHYRACAHHLIHSMLVPIITSESEISESWQNPPRMLMPSLFPNVPPYLTFSTRRSKGTIVLPELHRVLKWRISKVLPKVVRHVLNNTGIRVMGHTNDFMGVWGRHLKVPLFEAVVPHQKVNHLPGSFQIGRKDFCWRSLKKKMRKHGERNFEFMPQTFIFPNDVKVLRKRWSEYSKQNVKWILKPPASARGVGIRVVSRWSQIPKDNRKLIVQRYIERPLLINGSKFDLRLYVLVTSVNPLRIFMYHDGLVRFASEKYSGSVETLNDRCMHLTNYSVNKVNVNYTKNEDANACRGHKWSIKALWSHLASLGIRTDCLWAALHSLVIRTILAGEGAINNAMKRHVRCKYSCYELFGFDVLLDDGLIPWLLEVNISPSLHADQPLDFQVKAPLVQAVLNTALFHVPPKLSREKQYSIASEMKLPPGPICYDSRLYSNSLSDAEKIKHSIFTHPTIEGRDHYINAILTDLTPDDVRCLIIAEDELARCSPLERIFPTTETYVYLKYTDTPRYYNRLLDAWEARYAKKRAEGIAWLKVCCAEKYHLIVPPAPARIDLTDNAAALRRANVEENVKRMTSNM